MFLAHGLGAHADADLAFYARGMYAGAGPGDLLLRGGGFEVGRLGWDRELGGLGWEAALSDPSRLAGAFGNFGSRRHLDAAFARWLAWAASSPGSRRLSLGEAFYRDQRLCGWLAAVEQAADLTGALPLQPANSAYVHDLLLAPPRADREASLAQKRAVALAGHGLADLPYNPDLDPSSRRRARQRAAKWRRQAAEAWNLLPDRLGLSRPP